MIVVRPDLESIERLLDQPLRLVVERARGLVEEQDRRVLEDGPGDRHALALAARQAHPAVADDRVVALGQGADEVVGVGGPGGGDHLVVGRVQPAVRGCSRATRAAEQRRLLGDQADRARAGWPRSRRGCPCHRCGSCRCVHVPQARDEADERRLARPGRADQREGLPCPDVEGRGRAGPVGRAGSANVTPSSAMRAAHRADRPGVRRRRGWSGACR